MVRGGLHRVRCVLKREQDTLQFGKKVEKCPALSLRTGLDLMGPRPDDTRAGKLCYQFRSPMAKPRMTISLLATNEQSM